MGFTFQKAVKEQSKGRMGIIGPSGCGKTFTMLTLMQAMAELAGGGKIAVIDTEHGSASKYADLFDFDTLILDSYHPQNYIDAIKVAGDAGYTFLGIDSLSHAWAGTDGALELVDRAAARSKSGNSYAAWREVTPLHNKLIEAILGSSCHVIATMRAKTEYVQEKNENGKTTIKKVGLAPIQRDGMEYEFDVTADMDLDHNFIVSKTRCSALDGAVIRKPDRELAATWYQWLTSGAVPVERKPSESNFADETTCKPPESPKPSGKSADFTKFYASASNLGLTEDDVHASAAEFFKLPSLKSLKDVAGLSQQKLNEFLMWLVSNKRKSA